MQRFMNDELWESATGGIMHNRMQAPAQLTEDERHKPRAIDNIPAR